MGILDDAIREHLELIRRRGATDTEVRRLEDEAFGPPTRPDEADFPESEEGQVSGNGLATEAALEEPEDVAAHEDVTTLLPAEEASEQSVETPGTGLEEPTGAHVTGDVDEPEGEPVLGEPPGEEPAAEPVAEEHAIVEEEPPAEAPEEEPPAVPEDATTLYDQGAGGDTDAELDLTLDEDEAPPEEPPSEEHPIDQPEGAVPLEPPIESLDTVEHPFPEEITESEESPPSDEHAIEEEQPAEPESAEETEASEEGDEDVLADTPEFLKDQPEDDELWFEQGEPKDFDF
jgi:hypothetical protein